MQRFEHEVFHVACDSTYAYADDAEEHLKKVQVDGWELVTVIPGGGGLLLFMKRPCESGEQ